MSKVMFNSLSPAYQDHQLHSTEMPLPHTRERGIRIDQEGTAIHLTFESGVGGHLIGQLDS